jgi:hypothetical protein
MKRRQYRRFAMNGAHRPDSRRVAQKGAGTLAPFARIAGLAVAVAFASALHLPVFNGARHRPDIRHSSSGIGIHGKTPAPAPIMGTDRPSASP